jgi:hypothetical protein
MRQKKHTSKPTKDPRPNVGQMGTPNRAIRARENLSRTLEDKPDEPPGDRGAAEKESEVQGSE